MQLVTMILQENNKKWIPRWEFEKLFQLFTARLEWLLSDYSLSNISYWIPPYSQVTESVISDITKYSEHWEQPEDNKKFRKVPLEKLSLETLLGSKSIVIDALVMWRD